jgi:hypothetical protein
VTFDKDSKTVKQAENPLKVEEEQAMLKDFAAAFKLDYRILVLSKDDQKKVYGDYKVNAIPTAVVIDRAGNVQLVKVGHSDENAKAIKDKIEELIKQK